MSKGKYLYDIKVDYSCGLCHTLFTSTYNFDLEHINEQYNEDVDIQNSFNEMIFSNENIYITEPEDCHINEFKILSKVEYNTSHDKYLTDNLFKSFDWFNKAVSLYVDYNAQKESIIEHIQKAYTEKIFRNWDSRNLKETTYLGFVNRSIKDGMKRIQHAEAIFKAILKEIKINAIKDFDNAMYEYLQSYPTKTQDMEEWEELLAIKTLRIGSGENLIITPIENPIDVDDFKINLLSHIGKFVSEIRFILSELIDSIMDYEQTSGTIYNRLDYDRLEEIFIQFKIRLIKEKKKHIIENQNYSVSLVDLFNEKENDTILNDKDTILSTLVSSFKKREKVQSMLDDIDEHYYISKSVKFEKRKLAIIVYILQYCELFNRMSYETFKKNICWYYGKENVSMKPNKIQEEAIQEYYKKEFLYKKYNISIK